MSNSLGWGFWFTFSLGIAWCLYRALFSQGWILDDELAHFLISRDVWENPSELLHSWSRTGRNLLHFIPAKLGLEAARVWTLVLSAIAVWLTGREAKRLEMSALWLLPILLCFQWWFPELSFPVLTQAPFMAVWMAGLFFAVRDRHVLAALCFGYLGLIRHEGIALTAFWGIWVIFTADGFARHLFTGRIKEAVSAFPRAVVLGLWTILPMALMNLASWWVRDEIPFLLFFESKPTDYYGSGPLWLYLRHLFASVGFPIALLMVIGCFWKPWEALKGRWDLVLYATYPAYLILHSVIYWKGLFASGGYYHFIMPMAPAVALVALRGTNWLTGRIGNGPLWLLVPVTIWTGLAMPQQQFSVSDSHLEELPKVEPKLNVVCPPMALSRMGQGAKEAARWVEENVTDQAWLTHYVAVSYFLRDFELGTSLDPWAEHTPQNAEPGTVLVWDTQYSVDTHGFTLKALGQERWDEVAQFAHGAIRIFIKE